MVVFIYKYQIPLSTYQRKGMEYNSFSKMIISVQCFHLFFFAAWNENIISSTHSVSQKLKEGLIPVFDSGTLNYYFPFRPQSSSGVPHVPTIIYVHECACAVTHTHYTSRSGTPSFSTPRAFFLRLQQTTAMAMMMPISSRMRKMAAAITPIEYTVEDKTRHHLIAELYFMLDFLYLSDIKTVA